MQALPQGVGWWTTISQVALLLLGALTLSQQAGQALWGSFVSYISQATSVYETLTSLEFTV